MLLDAGEVPYFENAVSRDSQTFELIVEHMIQVHGYKKIYCLTGPKKFIQSVERLEAYCYVMQRHDLYYDESYYAYGDFWRQIISGLYEMFIHYLPVRIAVKYCGVTVPERAAAFPIMR